MNTEQAAEAMERVRRVNAGDDVADVYAEMLKYHGYEGLDTVAYSMCDSDRALLARLFIAGRDETNALRTQLAAAKAECERLSLQIESAKVAAGWHPDDERSIADEIAYLRDKTRGTTESELLVKLDKANHDNAAAFDLVSRVRFALGDDGKRMLPEFLEYCKLLVTELAASKVSAKDRDFEWWQSLCLVDNVAPTPEAVKQWLLVENEYHEKQLRQELTALRAADEANKRAMQMALDNMIDQCDTSQNDMKVRDALTAALAAGDGGGE